jgi:hypothetical protein
MAKQSLETLMKAREPIAQGPGYIVGQLLPIDQIRTDGGTQARAGLDEPTVAEYAESWLQLSRKPNGLNEMPPIVVYYDGADHWLADGFHRLAAYKRFLDGGSASAAPRAIRAIIQQGQRRDAVLAACGANATHGLRRTNADKRRAIETLLRDEEWQQWSDSEIARRVIVDHKTVAAVRAQLYPGNSQDSRTVERSGTTYQQKVKQPTPASPSDDDKHIAAARMLLAAAARLGERSGTQSYQEAYAHAYQINNLTLRSQIFGEIDRAVDPDEHAAEIMKKAASCCFDCGATANLTPPPADKPYGVTLCERCRDRRGTPTTRGLSEQAIAAGWTLKMEAGQWCAEAGELFRGWFGPPHSEEAHRRAVEAAESATAGLDLIVAQRTDPHQADPVAPPRAAAPSADEFASVQARWAALGYRLLLDLAGPTNDRYRLQPPGGRVGIANMQWHEVLSRLAIREVAAPLGTDRHAYERAEAADQAQIAEARAALLRGDHAVATDALSQVQVATWQALEAAQAALLARGWAFLPAESPSGWIRLDHAKLGYECTEPTIEMAIREATALQADYDRIAQLRDPGHDPGGLSWPGKAHTRFLATAELATWCAGQHQVLSADERALLVKDARQMIAELEKLIEALS